MSVAVYQKYFDTLGKNYKNTIGVYDNNSYIVACNRKEFIGSKIKEINVPHVSYSLSNEKYSLFMEGAISMVEMVAPIIRASIMAVEEFDREGEDEQYLYKQIINGNCEDILWRAKNLGIEDEEIRVVFVVNVSSKHMYLARDIVKEVAPVREGDGLFVNGSSELVFVRKCKSEPSNTKLTNIAQQISTGITSEIFEQPSIGIGCIVNNLADIEKSYKTAVSALDVGYIFENRNKTYSYMNLGISRLITSVPVEKCKAFLHEVMNDDVLREIDNDTMLTVQRFFDYDLNISLAARELYIHRNTLVYRLDRVQDKTGLDVRKFEDALLFKMAMLIQRYLRSGRK